MLLPRRGRILGAFAVLIALAGCAAPESKPSPEGPAEKAAEPGAPDPGAADGPASPADGDSVKPDADPAQDPPPDGDAPPIGGNGPLDELAKELTLRDQEREALARHYFETGKRYYDAFDYPKAVENFARAAEAAPNDPEIRNYLLMARLLSGQHEAKFETITEVLGREKEVSIQQEQEQLKRLYDEGQALMEAGQFDKATLRFEQVLEKIRWFPYKIDTQGYEESARAFIVRARRQQRERQISQQEEIERRALEQAREEQVRYLQERRQQTELLLRRALDQIQLRQYEAAEATVGEVLTKDPQNEEALKLRDLAIEGRHAVSRQRIIQDTTEGHLRDREEAIEAGIPYLPDGVRWPDREYWKEVVQKRTVGIQEEEDREPEWVKEYRQILASRTVTLNFPDTPFAEVVSFLQDITGLNITIGASVDAEEKTVRLRLRDILLQDAMKIILEQTGLAMTYANETLLITQPEEARGEYVLEIFDVQDLLSRIPDFPGDKIRVASDQGGGGGGGGGGAFTFEEEEESGGVVLDPDQLEQIITNSIGEDHWDDPASIEIHRGQVIVNQTRELQREIQRVLRNLRRNTGMFVQVETRFVRMTDDFLRDIGVDLRGLGRSIPIGVPAGTVAPEFGFPQNLDPNIPTSNTPGAIDMGFGRQIPVSGTARQGRIGPTGPGGFPFFGSDMLGGRTQNILNGGDAYFTGERLNGTSVGASNIAKGLAAQISVLDPFQLNAILRAEEENGRRKIVDAPVITAANRQRVSVSVITQRAYISDYELSSGGTGQVVAEVADPIIETFQEGIVLDVRPTISADRKYVTLDVKPTLATLVNGSFRQIPVNLGTISNAAINVNIEVPEVTLQEAFTSVTVPDGGTALLGGFRKINHKEETSGLPFLDHIPLVRLLFQRQGELYETESLLILITARTISLKDEERRLFNLGSNE